MPAPYSVDLRERVLHACTREGLKRAEAAVRFRVAERTVYNWLKDCKSGRTEPRPHAGGRASAISGAVAEALIALVAEANDRTLGEYADQLAERTGVRVSRSAVDRALRRLGYTRKKRHSAPTSRRASRYGRVALSTGSRSMR